MDTCGTGGDSSGTFNISTISAIVAAAAGAHIAKHGNRSATSKCGSADILEALGVKIELPPEKVERSIEEVGIGFMYAPSFHPAMKFAGPSRKEIGIRTIFNILGPLTNPAGAKIQLIGVFSEELTDLLALVLQKLGSKEVMAVFGRDMLDEISVCDRTKISHLKDGAIRTYDIEPKDFRMKRWDKRELLGGTVIENVKITNDDIKGRYRSEKGRSAPEYRRRPVLEQVAADMASGIEMAKETIDSGKALRKLEELVRFTNS